jgi:hypothetical protein
MWLAIRTTAPAHGKPLLAIKKEFAILAAVDLKPVQE